MLPSPIPCIKVNITQKQEKNNVMAPEKGLDSANVVTTFPPLVSFIGQLYVSPKARSFPYGILKKMLCKLKKVSCLLQQICTCCSLFHV